VDGPDDVRFGIETDVSGHGRDQYVSCIPRARDRERLAFQVSDGPHALAREDLDAADVDAGQENDRVAGIDTKAHRGTEQHSDVGLARCERVLLPADTLLDVLDVSEPLALEELLGHVLWRLAERRPIEQPDPLRLRWRLRKRPV